MSERKFFSGGIMIPLFSAFCGAVVTALAMVYQGWSASVTVPLASAAVCIGSLCSGMCAAFFKKEKGLLNGAVQGLLFASILLLAALGNDNSVEILHLIRCVAVILCGAIGGLLGMNLRDHKH